jgi:uncharacterized membrane protein
VVRVVVTVLGLKPGVEARVRTVLG